MKIEKMYGKTIWFSMLLMLLISFAAHVSAAEKEPEKGWRFEGGLYLWGASIGGKSVYDTDIEVDFDDIFSSLKLAYMGMAGVRWKKWLLFTDLIYLNLKDSGPVAPGLNADVELTGWVVTPFAGYTLVDMERFSLDVIGGARYLNLKSDLNVNGISKGPSGSKWDGIVGIRGNVKLTQTWYLPYHQDVGTGGSRFTWQGFGGLGYRFKWFDVVAGYRYLSWDFDDSKVFDNINFSGPLLGIKFTF